MSYTDDTLLERIEELLEGQYDSAVEVRDEVTLEVPAENYHAVCEQLANTPAFCFEQLTDLCAMDYSEYPGMADKKFAVV
jgi:NADH-quinone oxidoreductase subunit C